MYGCVWSFNKQFIDKKYTRGRCQSRLTDDDNKPLSSLLLLLKPPPPPPPPQIIIIIIIIIIIKTAILGTAHILRKVLT